MVEANPTDEEKLVHGKVQVLTLSFEDEVEQPPMGSECFE